MDNYTSTSHKIREIWENSVGLFTADSLLEFVLRSLKNQTKTVIRLKGCWFIEGSSYPHSYNGADTFYDEYGSAQIKAALYNSGAFIYHSPWIQVNKFTGGRVLDLGNALLTGKFFQVIFLVGDYTAEEDIDFENESLDNGLPENKLRYRIEKDGNNYYLVLDNMSEITAFTKFKFVVKYFKVK